MANLMMQYGDIENGKLTVPFYFEYMKRDEPFSMTYNHFHAYFELYYMLSGQRQYFIENTLYSVNTGDLVLIGKNELHKTLHNLSPSHERIVIYFDERFISMASNQHFKLLLSVFQPKHHLVRLPSNEQKRIHTLFQRIQIELNQREVGYELFLANALIDILLSAARFRRHNPSDFISHENAAQAKCSEIVDYLKNHYEETIRLQELAERFFLSPSYMCHLFKQQTGFTLIDYLNLIRIRESQSMLMETGKKITDIAASVGFNNFSHFGKMFKKITLTSPRDFRRQQER
jgi:YesN/AraC family two-component response regulator